MYSYNLRKSSLVGIGGKYSPEEEYTYIQLWISMTILEVQLLLFRRQLEGTHILKIGYLKILNIDLYIKAPNVFSSILVSHLDCFQDFIRKKEQEFV